jgi:hypothetical protein
MLMHFYLHDSINEKTFNTYLQVLPNLGICLKPIYRFTQLTIFEILYLHQCQICILLLFILRPSKDKCNFFPKNVYQLSKIIWVSTKIQTKYR